MDRTHHISPGITRFTRVRIRYSVPKVWWRRWACAIVGRPTDVPREIDRFLRIAADEPVAAIRVKDTETGKDVSDRYVSGPARVAVFDFSAGSRRGDWGDR